MLDVCLICIGDNVMIGFNCQFLIFFYLLDLQECNLGVEYGKFIIIGDNFWVGGGVIVFFGVILGNNVVVGVGVVIIKFFGDNVVLVGNFVCVIKEIFVKQK